jgi:hypothetical protein
LEPVVKSGNFFIIKKVEIWLSEVPLKQNMFFTVLNKNFQSISQNNAFDISDFYLKFIFVFYRVKTSPSTTFCPQPVLLAQV